MAQPTQCSSGGWVASRPVGSPGRIPTVGVNTIIMEITQRETK